MRTAAADVRELCAEHGIVLRRLARLQQQVGEQLQASARRLAELEARNLRLQAELVRSRSAAVWGLPPLGRAPAIRSAVASPRVQRAPGMREAQAVICQAACVGHAHPWLDDGQCRQTGRACDRLHGAAPVPEATDAQETG